MSEGTPSHEVIEQLAALFRRNGYVRWLDPKRRKKEKRKYKKGDEFRLVAQSTTELQTIRRLLQAAGFKPGRSYSQAGRWRQPVYGRAEVARFLALIGETKDASTKRARSTRKASHAAVVGVVAAGVAGRAIHRTAR